MSVLKMKLEREEGAAPERRGDGRSERRTVYKQLSFSTRRQVAPYSSLSCNFPEWRPESRLMFSNQLASLIAIRSSQAVREL